MEMVPWVVSRVIAQNFLEEAPHSGTNQEEEQLVPC